MALSGDYPKLSVRVLATGVAAVFQALSLLLLARTVGPSAFGDFGILLSTGYVAGAALSFGLSVQALRAASMKSSKSALFTMLVIRVATSGTVGILLVITAFAAGVVDSAIVFAAVSFIFTELISELVQASLSGLGRQHLASAILVPQRALTLCAVALPVVVGQTVWAQFAAATLLGLLMSMLSLGIVVTPRLLSIRRVLRTSVGYWAAGVAGSLGQFDVVVASFAVSNPASGLVSAGSRIGTPLNLIPNAMLSVFVPRFSVDSGKARIASFLRLRRLAFAYAALLMAASPLIASALVWILGPAYSNGWPFYVSVTLAAALSGLSQVYQALVYSDGRPIVAAVFVGTGAIFGLILLAIGGLLGGLAGMSVGPIAGQALILGLFHAHWARSGRRGGGPA